MQKFKRIVITILVVVLVVCLSAPCFADPVTAISSAELFGALASTYAASRGIGVVVSENNVAGSKSAPIPSDVSRILWNSGYTAYNGSLDVVNQQTIDEWAEFATANMQVSVAPAGNLSPTSTTFRMGSALVEWFDKYFEHLLTVDLGVPSESGVYHTSGNFFNSTIASVSTSSRFLPFFPSGTSSSAGMPIAVDGTSTYYAYVRSTSSGSSRVVPYIFGGRMCFVSDGESDIVVAGTGQYADSSGATNTAIHVSSGTAYYRLFTGWTGLTALEDVLTVSSLQEAALDYFGSATVSGDVSAIQLRPEDKYNEGLRDKDGVVLPKGDVYIPDTSADTYQPDVFTGTWPVPWTDSFSGVGALPDVLALVQDLVNSGDSVLELESVVPDPVVVPFLPPAGIDDLPSFDFNLSGIWHYVTEWVGSIGSGFSLIRSVWSSLPYAMIVPIYASLVVVIVLGMYRRFFM